MSPKEIELLDLFAASVLQGIYAAKSEEGIHQADIAKLAYSQAEWMLSARKQCLEKAAKPRRRGGESASSFAA